jgi:hypothetical protein
MEQSAGVVHKNIGVEMVKEHKTAKICKLSIAPSIKLSATHSL